MKFFIAGGIADTIILSIIFSIVSAFTLPTPDTDQAGYPKTEQCEVKGCKS